MTHYDVLGAEPGATRSELRAAYEAAAARSHPEKVAGPDPTARRLAAQRTRRLNEAWRVVGHPGRRAVYDEVVAGGDR